MPYRIDTPEGWFRKYRRDIHVLEYEIPEDFEKLSSRQQEALRKQYDKDSQILERWIKANLPRVELTILGPSEYSDYISGGPTMKVPDFDVSAREAFEQHWAVGRPWRVRIEPYADWAKKIESVRLLEIPTSPNVSCRWWDTPQGLILMSTDQEGNLLSRSDAVWRLKQLRPEFVFTNFFAHPYGEYVVQSDNGSEKRYVVIARGSYKTPEWSGEDYKKNRRRLGKLRAALGLTRSHKVRVVVDDF